MRTIKLTIEYDGTHYCGWQRQDNGPTIQETIEQTLPRLVQHDSKLIGASRTDAGVHAQGQVAHFQTSSVIPLYGLRRGLNTILPDDIAVTEVAEVPQTFHARFQAIGKLYRYQLLVRDCPSPLLRLRTWRCPVPLDVDAMQRAGAHLVGEHDFAAFCKTHSDAKTTIRRVNSVAVTASNELISIDVHGAGFLRNMVRIIAGTLVDVGEGRIADGDVPSILASTDRTAAGRTAPAHGLTLIRVFY